MKKLLIILGPTSTGKTALALRLAKLLEGELVSCDSRQVYKYLDILTNKLPGRGEKVKIERHNKYWIMNGIKVWMYDVVDPQTVYTVADYVPEASKVIEEVVNSGRLAIIVGGTGLYLKALLEGLSYLNVPVNPKLREELEECSKEELQNRLIALSPISWNKLNQSDKENKRRLLRSIEIAYMYPYRKLKQITFGLNKKYDILKIGLLAPRPEIYKKINIRAWEWIMEGVVEEVKSLLERGVPQARFKQLGLGYAVVVDYLNKEINRDEMLKKMQEKTRQYARRQLTWFKREKDVNWVDITENKYPERVEKEIAKWYYCRNAQ